MAKNKRQSFQQGAIILSLAAVLTKIIGALFKIPIQREEIAGITGFGYFATAYDIYLPVYTIAIAGFPIAVSRMVSASVSLRRYRDVQVIYRVARKVFFVTGTVGALVMLGAAFVYPGFVGIPGSFWPMVMMAPAVFFCCMVSAHRGLYEGLRNMTPTAVSQVIEALGKLVLGLGLAVGALRWGQWQYAQGKPVFGTMASSAAHARELSLPFIAAGAMLGVTAGSFFALVYMVIRHHRLGTGITKEELAAAPVPDSSRTVFRELMRIAVPVAMGALATQLTNLIDVASLQRCLKTVLEQHGDVLRGMYEPWLTASGTKDILSWLIGGRGTAMTYVNLIPNITLTFGISALPVITSAWAVKNRERLVRTVESVIRLTLLVALPASIGLAVLAKPIIFLIYGQQHVAALVGPLLAVLGAAVVFICLTGPINAMLQAVGRADIPMKIILAGGPYQAGPQRDSGSPAPDQHHGFRLQHPCLLRVHGDSQPVQPEKSHRRTSTDRPGVPAAADRRALLRGGRLGGERAAGTGDFRQGRHRGGHWFGGAGVSGGPAFGARFYERRYFKSSKRRKNRANT